MRESGANLGKFVLGSKNSYEERVDWCLQGTPNGWVGGIKGRIIVGNKTKIWSHAVWELIIIASILVLLREEWEPTGGISSIS